MNWKKDQEFIKNPFRVDGITERFYDKPGKAMYTMDGVDPDTGEVKPLFTAPERKLILHDTKSYAKVFADTGDIIRDLTPSATKVYLYTIVNLKVNWDSVFLNVDDACVWCKFSKTTYYRALDELLDRKIIARKLGSYLEYWINPNIFYNGDRVKLFRYLKQNINTKP